MARNKRISKPKEPVKLRFKELANGNRSIYLDIYSKGKRSYEFLKMYLIPEVDEAARVQNANTLQAANFIKSQRIIQLTNDEAGVIKRDDVLSKVLLLDFVDSYRKRKEEAGQSLSNALNVERMAKHLRAYKGENVRLIDVDEDYCRGFIRYLLSAKAVYGTKNPVTKPLCKRTAQQYFIYFASVLNDAVRRRLIPTNPTKHLTTDDKRLLKSAPALRGYLTLEEVQNLIETDCKKPQTKQAFLFAVFSGLRISDIRALRWSDFERDGDQWRISILMTKTKERLYLPLSAEAMRWLPDRADADRAGYVFAKLPKTPIGMSSQLKSWAKAAGIEKPVCFHMSRHTFATSLLTLGADIYTTSKLLGHKNIATTQIYAEIVNQKKVDAVNLMGAAFGTSRKEAKDE